MPVSAMSPLMLRTVFFLSFLPPDTSFNRKVSLWRGRFTSVVFASGAWPESVFTGRLPISDSRFCRRSAGVVAPSIPRGRTDLVPRTSQRNVAMQVSNALYHWPVHSVRVNARKTNGPAYGACARATTALNSFTTMFGERTSDSWVPVPND